MQKGDGAGDAAAAWERKMIVKHEVRTGSGSDGVSTHLTAEIART